MDNARAAAVLEAAEALFREEESNGGLAVITDGPLRIGERLNFPPWEVLVLLRMLHRKGLVALFNSFGSQVTIARDQSLLKPPTAVITDGGKNAKLSRGRRGRPSEAPAEDEQPPEIAALMAYIEQLERELDETQAKLDTSEKRRRNISDARQQSDSAKTAAETELRRVKAENSTLKQAADKVPELERQITELREQRKIPADLAATIARLTP